MTVELGGVGSEDRKKAVKKYFTRPPDPRDEDRARQLLKASIALGVLTIACGVTGLTLRAPWLYVVLLLSAVVAIGLLIYSLEQLATYKRRLAKAEPKPSDRQMDDMTRADLKRAADRAIRRLGVTLDELELYSRDVDPLSAGQEPRLADQGRGPIAVFGPADGAEAIDGVDRKLRFTSYDIMVICPTGHNLGIFECGLDLASGRLRNEETREYHYTDVVAVGTMTKSTSAIDISLVDRSGTYSATLNRALYRTFEVIVSSGDRSSIVVGIKDEDEDAGSFKLQESGIDSVIDAVRRMLREKKGGAVSSM